MKLITASQCRAARGLLNWSQPDLAQRCGVHVQTISSFEQDLGSPTKRTLQKIAQCFEDLGIEFTDGDGVRFSVSDVVQYSGQEGFVHFMTDVIEVSRKGDPNICVSNVNEQDWENNLPSGFAQYYRGEMKKLPKLTSRIIVKEEDTFHTAKDFAEYRCVPASIFSEDVSYYAYGDNLALITFYNSSVQILMLRNKRFANSFRIMFDAIWNNYKVLQ